MAEFSTYKAFQNFRQHVLRESRYVHNEDAQSFLKTVLETSQKRHHEIPRRAHILSRAEWTWWRTLEQEGDEFEVPAPYSQDRMRPLYMQPKRDVSIQRVFRVCILRRIKKRLCPKSGHPLATTYQSASSRHSRPLTLVDCSVGHDSGINLYFDFDNCAIMSRCGRTGKGRLERYRPRIFRTGHG